MPSLALTPPASALVHHSVPCPCTSPVHGWGYKDILIASDPQDPKTTTPSSCPFGSVLSVIFFFFFKEGLCLPHGQKCFFPGAGRMAQHLRILAVPPLGEP